MRPFRERIFDHADYICATIAKYTENWDLAEDITQDTMVRALEYEDKFSERGTEQNSSLRGWLMHMAMNVMRNRLNKIKRDCLKSSEYLQQQPETRTETPEELVSKSRINPELIKILVQYNRRTDAEYLSVLSLKAQGYTHKEIARKLDIPHGTSLTRLYRAREIFQKDERLQALAQDYGICTT